MILVEVALFTDHVKAMTAQYRTLLGVDPVASGPGMAIFQRAGVEYLIHERYEPAAGELPCEDHLAYGSGDIDGDFTRLLDAGWTELAPPADHEWGRSAYLRDPDGRMVELEAIPADESTG